MEKIQIRTAALAVLFVLSAMPQVALAFTTVDTLPWPSRGRFPAYPAEPLPLTDWWVEGGLMYDTNVLRRQNDVRDDFVGRVGVGVRHLQRIVGRQSLQLEGRVTGYGYKDLDNLDHIGYLANAIWLWEVGNDLSGTLAAGREQRLSDLSERQDGVRDLVTMTRFGGSAAYRLGPNSRLRTAFDTALGERTLTASAKLRATSVSFGADWVTPLQNHLGLEYRLTQGDAPVPELVAPVGTFVNNDFHEKEVAVVGDYLAPDQRLRLNGRIGHTRRTYSQIGGRDFSGTTYRGGFDWSVGAKTALEFFAYSEPRSIIDIAARHVLAKGTLLGPRWAYSAKTVFSLNWVRERQTGVGDPAVATAAVPLRDELVNTIRLGMGWEPERHWQVGFGLDRGTRYSNYFGRSYNYSAAMANVAYHF
jgi:hypothetical protein